MTDAEYIELRERYAGNALNGLISLAASDDAASEMGIDEGLHKIAEAAFVIGEAMAAEAMQRRAIPPKR